jgi:dienelactone hydrolase
MRIARRRAASELFSFVVLLELLAWNPNVPAQSRAISKIETLSTQQHSMRYEVFGAPSSHSTIIFLHGASGPSVPFYREQAAFLAAQGYLVLFPHYFESTNDNMPGEQNYRSWVQAVTDLLIEQRSIPGNETRKFGLIGTSLGASVALAAGSQSLPVEAIADWYGTLPDSFFYRFKSMPPLLILHGELDNNLPITNARQLQRLCEMKNLTCESHFYSDQGHGFTGAALIDAQQRTLTFFAKYL